MTTISQQPQSPVKTPTFHRDLRPVDQEHPHILTLRRLRAMAYRAAVARNTTIDMLEVLHNALQPNPPEVLSRLTEEAQARRKEAATALTEIERELAGHGLPTLEQQADPLALDDGEACPNEERDGQVVRDLATLSGLVEAQALVRARLAEIF